MTQEDRELLLKDICTRLPYGIFVKEGDVDDRVIYTYDYHPHIETCKPYLRPMSSMTEEEEDEYMIARQKDIAEAYIHATPQNAIDWLNAHYFDYRGLIEKGLALEAPEGMYENG
jgi:hypothetical protein